PREPGHHPHVPRGRPRTKTARPREAPRHESWASPVPASRPASRLPRGPVIMRTQARGPPSSSVHHVTPGPHNSEVRIVPHHHHPVRPPTRSRLVGELRDVLRVQAQVPIPALHHHLLLHVLAPAPRRAPDRVLRRAMEPLPGALRQLRRPPPPVPH